MAAVAAQPQPHQPQQQQQQQQYHYQQQIYPAQSIMEDISDDDQDDDDESIEGDLMDPAHAHFYHQQQQQALYYQQHQQQHNSLGEAGQAGNGAGAGAGAGPSGQNGGQQGMEGDDDVYSDEESDTDSMPDENIDFSLTYALHTFLATVEGQASVVKGDSLVLLDDANSYWWLVRVLKTEDVGYIPAENIETPYERLARLNKHRNVDLAAATLLEKQAGTVQGREKLKSVIAGKSKLLRRDLSGEVSEEGGSRRVVFAPPTYVDHPGVTWSSDEDDDESGDEGEMDVEQAERESVEEQGVHYGDARHEADVHQVEQSIEMEPDDGVEWADGAVAEQRQRQGPGSNQQQPSSGAPVQPKSNNPFAPQPPETSGVNPSASSTSLASNSGSVILDPAQAGNDTRRITATPAVASGPGPGPGPGPLLPSAIQQQQAGSRNVSGQSVNSVASGVSVASATSSQRSGTPTSPDEANKKSKMKKKGSKEELDGEKKKRGMLGGLFHRKGKDKGGKGLSGNEARSSEESMVSGAAESSPMSQTRWSDDRAQISSREAQSQQQQQQQQQQLQPQSQLQQPAQQANGVSAHGLRLQQQDQARMQSYTSKYLNKSPSSELHSPTTAEAAAAVAQSAAAMRLTASMSLSTTNGNSGRPSSIILSPNPAGPPLLNVIRIFAGDHVKSESSFKTALINETTSSSDLIRQATQRFHLVIGSNATYYITVRDVNGEETELGPDEKPLLAFQDAVKRWALESNEDLTARMGAITPTVKRSSVSSISSVVSLSSHPAIAKLGMNDFSDDSAVKIYLNRREGAGPQSGMPEPSSEFSSYSTQLSTVPESSPENKSGEWSQVESPKQRFNPSLRISTTGQASPEKFASPSARFTIQLVIHASDLPDGSVFDPVSDAIIPRSMLRDRHTAPTEPRKRLLTLPRNANVVEVIEQGLERFGISEGVVDGGDDVEDKVGKRRSMTRVRYSLAAMANGDERSLFVSGRILDVYTTPPSFRPMEKTTPEQRRRSRDLQLNSGSAADILPSDPVFVLRRVGPRGLTGARVDVSTPRQPNAPGHGNGETRSPAEIIAAQRAASRANQKALIRAQNNLSQGVDIMLPDQKGTFRSSRLMEADGEVVRYSYIDGDGETYDISELLEEEWAADGSSNAKQNQSSTLRPPMLARMATDRSEYITAPSTPEEGAEKDRSLSSALALAAPAPIHDPRERGSLDILRGVAGGVGEHGTVEKLNRVIEKVKSGKGSTSSEQVARQQFGYGAQPGPARHSTASSGRSTPQRLSDDQGKADVNATPRASLMDRSSANYSQGHSQDQSHSQHQSFDSAAASVNRIVASSRHRQQPSIASIISVAEADASTGRAHEREHDHEHDHDGRSEGSSTPITATSSTHPTPPFSNTSGSIGLRVLGSMSPTPRSGPVRYKDDFGMKEMMAVIAVRAGEYGPPTRARNRNSNRQIDKGEDVDRVMRGEKVDWEGVHPDIKVCFEGVANRLQSLDREIDELLAEVGELGRGRALSI